MDVRQQIRTMPIRPFQYLIIGICLVITMIDGYEILIMAIIAPTLVGFLLAAGWTPEGTYQAFAVVLVFAGLATLALDWTYRGTQRGPGDA